jgi:hypothetical protein
MTAEVEAWLGVPWASLRFKYVFAGEHSHDVRRYSHPHWTQRHNPFLGRNAPNTFLWGWREWHALVLGHTVPRGARSASKIVFGTSSVNVGVGVVFVATWGETTAAQFIRCMAHETGEEVLEIPHFRSNLLGGHVSGVFMKLPPNSWDANTPFTCCNGHQIISYIGTHDCLEVGDSCQYYSCLQDVHQASMHLSFTEMHETGKWYRRVMRPFGVHSLRLAIKSMAVLENCRLDWRMQVLPLFSVMDPTVLHAFFACKRSTRRLLDHYLHWYLRDGMNDPLHASLSGMLSRVVPRGHNKTVFAQFNKPCYAPLLHECSERCIADTKRVVKEVLGGERRCSFASRRVCAYLFDKSQYFFLR